MRENSKRKNLLALLPRVPLALTLGLVGVINILDGSSLPLAKLRSIKTLDTIEQSLSAVGGTAEVILGIMLLVGGIGLLRRLSFACTLAVLLMVMTLAIDFAQGKRGIDFAVQVIILGAASSAISLRRLKLAHADMVFSPAAVGSRLLADLVQGNQILPAFRDLLEGQIKKV